MASMNISLPDPMRDYVQRRIDDGQYASISDYVRNVIRRDQSTIDDDQRWLAELDASIGKVWPRCTPVAASTSTGHATRY